MIEIGLIGMTGFLAATAFGPALASSMELATTSTAGAMVSGAVVGSTTAFVSGAISGNLSLKGVLLGALGGALTVASPTS